jgi:pectate lyase
MTGKKIVTVFLLVCYLTVCCISTIAVAGTGMMVIEDFEGYTSAGEIMTAIFGGSITAQRDVVPKYELNHEYVFDGANCFGIGGTYTKAEDGYIGGLITPKMSVSTAGQNWTGFDYLQFWVKNTAAGVAGLKLELYDGSAVHTLPGTSFECGYETRPGTDVFQTLTGNNNSRINIPAGYEGMIRLPLSLYTTLTGKSSIQKIYLGMNINRTGVSGAFVYYDYFHVTAEGYRRPDPAPYYPEPFDEFVRINEQTMKLNYTAKMDALNQSNTVYLEVLNEDGQSLGIQYAETDNANYANINYLLPPSIAPGHYKLRVWIRENPHISSEFVFPFYGREQLAYSDIYDTKYEDAVELLDKLEIISGYFGNTFKPEQNITYGELASYIVNLSGLSLQTVIGYSEISNLDLQEEAAYNVAVMMIVKALGYTASSLSQYVSLGRNIGVTREVVGTAALRGNIAIMLKNALTIELYSNGQGTGISAMNKNFEQEMDDIRYEAAVVYGENILKFDRDVYGISPSPMMIDGINIYTKQPAVYMYGGNKSVLSNFASQQNTLRTLVALTNMTGDNRYKNRAMEAVDYMLSNITDANGTPYMGGHTWWDSFGEKTANSKTYALELKSFFPYYDIWYETDAEAASRTVGAMWDSKMRDWSILLFSRHGGYNKTPTAVWDNGFSDPDPWYKPASGDLPFFMSGIDLVLAAVKDAQYADNEKAGVWAKRLLGIYAKAADETTGLIPDIFLLSGGSSITDRGLDQFGMDYPQATEGNIQGTYNVTAASMPDMTALYDAGLIDAEMFNWLVNNERGCLQYQYDAATHKNKYILADGTDLTGYTLKKDGYFGNTGTVLQAAEVGRNLLFTSVSLYMKTDEQGFWDFARDVAGYFGLGDIGTAPGVGVQVNLATKSVTMGNIFAMCDLYEATGCADYLKLAKAISNNSMILYKRGFFMTVPERAYINNWGYNKVYVNFNDKDAWAILRIEAAMQGKSGQIPAFTNSYGDVLDDYDGFTRATIGANTAIFSGEFDIEEVIDLNLGASEDAAPGGVPAVRTYYTEDAPSNRTIEFGMYVKNQDDAHTLMPIIVVYDGDDNIMRAVPFTRISDKNEYINCVLTLTDEEEADAEYVRCYFWDGNTFEPMANAIRRAW